MNALKLTVLLLLCSWVNPAIAQITGTVTGPKEAVLLTNHEGID